MTTYIINFILCSGLLLAVYHLFLRNENLYKFNRFYLLFSLVFSLTVPAISVKIYRNETLPAEHYEQAPAHVAVGTAQTHYSINKQAPVRQEATQWEQLVIAYADSLPYAIAVLYSIVMVIMLFRFMRNIYLISRKAKKGESRLIDGAGLVLIDEEVTPHSFFKYIFINKADYNDGLVEPEIICHEQTHIKQLHSLDIIFIELVQAICWFNPLIPFYRKAIQLNHEFLADEAVIKNYVNTRAYQGLLLSKASQLSGLYLSSQFNYSITKKRFIMMTKNTSAKVALYKKFAVIPVLAVAVLVFCNRVTAQSPVAQQAPIKLIPVIPVAQDRSEKMIAPDQSENMIAKTANHKVILPATSPQQQSTFQDKIQKTNTIYLKADGVGANKKDMGWYEVTEADWKELMGTDPALFKGYGVNIDKSITWDDAQQFIKKLNAKYHVSYRLPTEKEWEYVTTSYYNRLQLKSKNGVAYDKIIIRSKGGSTAATTITHNAKAGFFIGNTYYDETAIKNLPAATIATLGNTVGAKDLLKKDYPGVNMHGYEAVFSYSTQTKLISEDQHLEKRIPELANEFK